MSWSTSRTEFPSDTRSCITPFKPIIFDGCRPIEGSSKTYKTPVVLFLTALANCIRCLSPVDRVDAERSKDIYESPRSINLFATSKKESQMLFPIGCISTGKEAGTALTHSITSDNGFLHTSSREIPINFGALALSERRVPMQSGQISSFKNFSTRFMPFSSLTFARAFSTVYTAL